MTAEDETMFAALYNGFVAAPLGDGWASVLYNPGVDCGGVVVRRSDLVMRLRSARQQGRFVVVNEKRLIPTLSRTLCEPGVDAVENELLGRGVAVRLRVPHSAAQFRAVLLSFSHRVVSARFESGLWYESPLRAEEWCAPGEVYVPDIRRLLRVYARNPVFREVRLGAQWALFSIDERSALAVKRREPPFQLPSRRPTTLLKRSVSSEALLEGVVKTGEWALVTQRGDVLPEDAPQIGWYARCSDLAVVCEARLRADVRFDGQLLWFVSDGVRYGCPLYRTKEMTK